MGEPSYRHKTFPTQIFRKLLVVGHGDDLLSFLMVVARVANPIAPFLATVFVPSPWSTLAMNACQSDPSSAHLAKTLGVSHLLHTKRPNQLRAFLYKLGNVEGEVLDRLLDLNVMLPGGGRPDAVVVLLQPSQQPHS
jgi:hypothetical protein